MNVADSNFTKSVMTHNASVRKTLSEMRGLVLAVAKDSPGVGAIEEGLRWGQHSFLTPETGSGSTIRIDAVRNRSDQCAMYFHCQSGLIETFKELYGRTFTYEGKRALIFDAGSQLPKRELAHCISLALTHHLRKKSKTR